MNGRSLGLAPPAGHEIHVPGHRLGQRRVAAALRQRPEVAADILHPAAASVRIHRLWIPIASRCGPAALSFATSSPAFPGLRSKTLRTTYVGTPPLRLGADDTRWAERTRHTGGARAQSTVTVQALVSLDSKPSTKTTPSVMYWTKSTA